MLRDTLLASRSCHGDSPRVLIDDRELPEPTPDAKDTFIIREESAI